MKGCSKLEWSCQIFDTTDVLLNIAAIRIQRITRIQQARTKVERIKNDAMALDVVEELISGGEVAAEEETLEEFADDELDYFGGLSPELFQLLYLPKILQASHLKIGGNFDEIKEEEVEEIVFTVMSSDKLWDTWSDMSDFDFAIDLGEYELVLNNLGLVVAGLTGVVTDTSVPVDTLDGKEQHGNGERAESGLSDDGEPGERGYGGSSDGALLSVEPDYYKRHRKKRLMFERRLIVQPA